MCRGQRSEFGVDGVSGAGEGSRKPCEEGVRRGREKYVRSRGGEPRRSEA